LGGADGLSTFHDLQDVVAHENGRAGVGKSHYLSPIRARFDAKQQIKIFANPVDAEVFTVWDCWR
jgi:hypothetical protein